MASPVKIDIPYNFVQREYQKPFWYAIQDDPVRRAVTVWHRRAGKDKTFLNAVLIQMLRRVGVYYYVFPEFNQGRKALWDNLDSSGFKTMSHIPEVLRKRTDQQQMLIELKNGSIFQVIGASDIDRIVGTNPVGIVFSEYSLMSPAVIGYLLPIVTENDGFMWFNFTPRGDNHARTLWEQAQRDDKWFSQMVTAKDSGVYSETELEEIRQEYIGIYGDDRLFNQEMLCDFSGAIQGSYYGEAIDLAEKQGRIGEFLYRPEHTVNTYWDLGVGDETAIWFVQFIDSKIHIVDYLEANSKGLDYYIKELQNKPYVYEDHYAPHDIRVREFGSGLSRIETAKSLGINFKITPKLTREDGINAARLLLARCYFNNTSDGVKLGLSALKQYHRKYNEELRVYDDKPQHDWSSNAADAFRYLAVAAKKHGQSGVTVTSDVPAYAKTGMIQSQGERRNPFARPKTWEDTDTEQMQFNKEYEI